MTMQGFPYEELFGYQPELYYLSQPGQEGFSPNQRRQFMGGFSDFYKRYQAALGGQIRQGQAPTLGIQQFGQANPFLDHWRNQPAEFRGEMPGQHVQRTNWIIPQR